MLALVRSARGRVADVRAALRNPSPEEFEHCIRLLDEAITELKEFEPAPIATPNPDLLRSEIAALQFELGVVRRIVEGGTELCAGWAKVLATAAAGYTQRGEPAAMPANRSISMEG